MKKLLLKTIALLYVAIVFIILIFMLATSYSGEDADVLDTISTGKQIPKNLEFLITYTQSTGDLSLMEQAGFSHEEALAVMNGDLTPIEQAVAESETASTPSNQEVIDGFPNGLTIVTDSSTNFGYSDVRGLAALISQHYYIGNGNSFIGTYSHPGVDSRRDNINHGKFPPSYHARISGSSDVYIWCNVTYGNDTTQARQDCSGSGTALHRLLGFNCPAYGTSNMQSGLASLGYTTVGNGHLPCSELQVGDFIVREGHVETVSYIDNTAVYTAGWGGDDAIEKIYLRGYNKSAPLTGQAGDLNNKNNSINYNNIVVLRCP